ncbi:MAG TPA: F0F1 ATP synthase subunit gamma, partial [Thermoanaerobaculia bacterium]|nr:F0F1 ATP synthase subunit gamma [Thermoanaerobaculia bacterium]
MANRRVLVKRRKAARNIRKITRTMQLVATARFQAAFNRVVAARPYTEKLAQVVSDLSRALGSDTDAQHSLLKAQHDTGRVALVVITSNRGLCGAYNANVLRKASAFLEQQSAEGRSVDVHMMGKKGVSYFRFLKRPMVEENVDIGDIPRFESVEPVADALMAKFLAGQVSAVHLAFMKFLSAGQQRAEIVQLLPLAEPAESGATGGSNLGPSSGVLRRAVSARIDALRATGVTEAVPVDLVTASASGLDPHVSP